MFAAATAARWTSPNRCPPGCLAAPHPLPPPGGPPRYARALPTTRATTDVKPLKNSSKCSDGLCWDVLETCNFLCFVYACRTAQYLQQSFDGDGLRANLSGLFLSLNYLLIPRYVLLLSGPRAVPHGSFQLRTSMAARYSCVWSSHVPFRVFTLDYRIAPRYISRYGAVAPSAGPCLRVIFPLARRSVRRGLSNIEENLKHAHVVIDVSTQRHP